MRFAFVLAALALSACSQPTPSPTAQGCVRSTSHDVVWTNEDAPDIITARSEGPTCAQAVVLFVARNAEGDPLWTFASTYYDLATGGVAPEDAPAVTEEQMDTFLAGWADVTEQRSAELPEWRAGDATLTAPTFSYSTAFSRETYEAIRARDSRMICYAAAVEATQCLVIDPGSNAPAMIVAYGP